MNESQIFAEAIKLANASDRAAYLDRACGADVVLRQRLEELLRVHESNSHFLEPIASSGESTKAFVAERPALAKSTGTSTYKPAVGEIGAMIAGRYRLVEPIGEGGMGSVWLAQQTEPVKRKVAIKLIKPGMDSKQVLARFDAERQALAMMDHPNIAKVFDGGLHEGRPYFVMELVKGTPITEFCDLRKLSPKDRLELFIPVCQAIQHAHQKGIIHRDIKPSNVLIALYDDLPVAKVIDFGIAKATGGTLTEQTIDTAFGGVVGTPQYMSPEQATFNNLDIDTRSDIYALGVLLYELLVGSPPFARKELEKKGILEILRVVREEEPPRPSVKLSTAETLPSISANRGTEPKKLMGILRNELDWIVLKALEKDRTRRYETATSFAQDVQRYLSGDPVQAHPPSTAYRLKKFVRRHRGQVVAASIVLLALVLGITGTTIGLLRATKAEAEATVALGQVSQEQVKTGQALAKATATDAVSRKQLARQYVEQGAQLLENGNAADALHWHIAAFAKEQDLIDSDRERVHRTRIATTIEACTRPSQILFHTTPVRQAAYSPDGRKLVTLAWSTTDKMELRVWDALTGQQIGPVIASPPDNTRGQPFVRFDATGSKVILVKNITNISNFSTLEVWEAHTGQLVSRSIKCIRRSTGLSQFSQTELLEVDPVDPTKPWPAKAIRHVELATLKHTELPNAAATAFRANRVALDPTGRYCFLPTDENGQCEIWSLNPLKRIRQWGDKSVLRFGTRKADGQIPAFPPQPYVQFSPDGQQLVVILSGPKSMIYAMETATGRELFPPIQLRPLRLPTTRYGIDISPDASKFLIDAVDDGVGEVTIYDAKTGKSLAAYKPHPAMTVSEAKFHPSGAYAIISSQLIPSGPQTITQRTSATVATHELFDIASAKPVGPPIFSVANPIYSPDATTVLIQDEQGTEKLRNVRTGEPASGSLRTAARRRLGSSSSASKFNSDGRFLVTMNEDAARLWDAQTGQPTTSLLRHRGRLTACEFNPVLDQCATLCEDGTVQLWENRPPPKSLEAWSSETIGMLEVDSTGTVVTARSPLQNGKPLLVWNIETGQQLRDFPFPKGNRQSEVVGVQCVQAAAGGRTLVVSGGTAGFQILDSATGRVLRAEPVTEKQGYFAAISPDRLRVVSLRYPDGEARWWDAATGTPLTAPITGNAAGLNFGPIFHDRPNPFLVTLRYRTEPGRAPEVEPTIWDPTKNAPTRLPWRPAGSSPVVDGAFKNLPPLPITRNGRTLLPLIGTDGLSAGWQLLDEATQQELARLPAGRADFTAEGHFAYVHGVNSLALWVAKSGQASSKFKLPENNTKSEFSVVVPQHGYRFNRDGSRIVFFRAVSGASSNWLLAPPELIDARSGRAIAPPLTQADPITGFDWSPDGTRFVTWGGRDVQLWDAQTGQRLGRPLNHKEVVQLARFSPDGKTLISRTKALQSSEIIRANSSGSSSTDGSGRWLPDTKRFLFSTTVFEPGGEVQVWDVASGESLVAPRLNMAWTPFLGQNRHSWEAYLPYEIGPYFSEDGQRLFTTPTPNTIQAWKVPLDTRPLSELIATAEAISGRRFQEPGNLIRLTEPEWTAARQITPDALAPALSLETQIARTRERARSHYLAGYWKVAHSEVNRAILLGSNQAEHFQMRGWCRAVLGEHQAALADLTKALELGLTGGEILAQRGTVLQALARYTEAAVEYKKMHQFPEVAAPRGWSVPAKNWWSDVAKLMSWAGHQKEYRLACDQLLANDGLKPPYNGEFMSFLYSANGLDDYSPLVAVCRKGLEEEKNPEQIPRWKSRLGWALYRSKQYAEAVKILEAIDLKNLEVRTIYRGGGNSLVLAMAYHHLGDRNKAEDYLRRGQEQSVAYEQQQAKTPSTTNLVPSILVREATQLIDSGPKPELAPPPRKK